MAIPPALTLRSRLLSPLITTYDVRLTTYDSG
jgi:hypothetical protein